MSGSSEKKKGIICRVLAKLVGMVARHPRGASFTILVLACAAVGVTISELKLRTSRSQLVDPSATYSETWKQYSETFGTHADLVVVVQAKNSDRALIRNVLEDLGTRLEREPDYFENVLYRVDQRRIRRKGLQFLSPKDLDTAARRVRWFAPIIENGQWDKVSLLKFSRELRGAIESGERNGKSVDHLYEHADQLAVSLNSFVDQYKDNPDYNGTPFLSPWPQLVSADLENNADDAGIAYLINEEGTVGRILVSPVENAAEVNSNHHAIKQLREHIQQLSDDYSESAPELRIALTGIPVLEHDELDRAQTDMLFAALLSFLAVGVLLSFGFRNMRHPMLLLLALVVSLAFTFALATLTIGHLNILSICFAAVLIGLGVDFGIHFFTRYLHFRQELYEVPEALELSAQSVGTGILTSALTTALAFGSAALTGFPGLAELGIIASGGILICAFVTFAFLPALIALADAEVEIEEIPTLVVGKLYRSAVAGFPLIVIVLSLIGTGAATSQAFRMDNGQLTPLVRYDSNILKLQDENLNSVRAERLLSESANESLLYAVAIASSRDEAVALKEQFQALPTVGYVSEFASRIPSPPDAAEQQKITAMIQTIHGLQAQPFRNANVGAAATEAELHSLYSTMTKSSSPVAVKASEPLREFLTVMAPLRQKPQAQETVFGAYETLMASSLMKEFDQVAAAGDLTPVRDSDFPASWTQRYYHEKDGAEQWLLKIYPAEDVWSDEPLTAFVQDLRSVKDDVTGVPVHNYEAGFRLHNSYKAITLYSLAVIAMFLLMDFLRPGQKLLTLIPPAIIVGLIGYTMFRRSGSYDLNLLVSIYLGMVCFVAAVLDIRNLRDTLLALTPPLVGSLLMLGMMGAMGIDLNPLNLIALPLILGIGVDDGIHMVNDYRRQAAGKRSEYVPSADTLSGVCLTSLTSVIGFGSLMISQHRGLQSLGQLMAIGVGSCMIVAVVLLPALLTLVARHQPASMEPVRLSRKSTDESSDSKDSASSQSKQSNHQQKQQGRRAA